MIRLIGPGGSGKTTAGSLLARRLGVRFVDLDERFLATVGDISSYIERHGYNAYAARNVGLYSEISAIADRNAVLALSSGFMTYQSDIHPRYARYRKEIACDPTTFVLLPSLDPEVCIAETVRRQIARPFARPPEREEEVIRNRFPIYMRIPATKIETSRPAPEVVGALLLGLAALHVVADTPPAACSRMKP